MGAIQVHVGGKMSQDKTNLHKVLDGVKESKNKAS
jgi:hypothetical protein